MFRSFLTAATTTLASGNLRLRGGPSLTPDQTVCDAPSTTHSTSNDFERGLPARCLLMSTVASGNAADSAAASALAFEPYVRHDMLPPSEPQREPPKSELLVVGGARRGSRWGRSAVRVRQR